LRKENCQSIYSMAENGLESARPGVYLAGVLVAGMHTNEIFIENGRFHGKLIAEAIAKSLSMNPE
ncbi:MAG TPA: hypothetical protein PKJ41_06100, partial [Bryobacteraceae bacterium]|nr:hypothetical protein [Bryobacteraceae bacterium]HPT24901.1 hypothetical protein [Bryobacteraceae bacterium]